MAPIHGYDNWFVSFYRPYKVFHGDVQVQPDVRGLFPLTHPDTEITELIDGPELIRRAYGLPFMDYTITRDGAVYDQQGNRVPLAPKNYRMSGRDDDAVTLHWRDPDGQERSRTYTVAWLLKSTYGCEI
jgi:hypothetical protein